MKIRIILIWILGFARLYGQDFDGSMSRMNLDCSDISSNCSLLFQKYLSENKIDSAKYLLKYWESKCGVSEPVFRAKILFNFKEKQSIEPIFNDSSMYYVNNYMSRIGKLDLVDISYDENLEFYGYIPLGKDFDNFTRNEAEKMKKEFSPETLENLICNLYSNNTDSFFIMLQSGLFKNSRLTNVYNKIVKKKLEEPEGHYSLISGIWIPTGAIARFGNHPTFGLQLGIKKGKMNYDFTILHNIGKSLNNYYAKRPSNGDSLELSNEFSQAFLGIDVGRDIYAKKRNEIQFTCGIGVEGFNALEENTEKKLKRASVTSYNFSFGTSYRYYISSLYYIGIRVKYNIVDYKLTNVIDFTGNPITIQLILGYVDNPNRNNNLKLLKYKLRK